VALLSMAYVQIEADERLEEGPEPLQFRSFLGADGGASNVSGGAPAANRAPGNSAFWNLEYYQPYFDVDTKMVLKRCYTTLLPTSSSYLTSHLTPAADLYGPFWTLTTLIFCLYVFSSLAHSIASYLSSEPIQYDFQLLSLAFILVYIYGIGWPTLLWLALRYNGLGEWGLIEAVSVWGYGQFVWIPVSLLCVIPVPLVRWILSGIGFLISGYFLCANVYPILASADSRVARLFIVPIVAFHAGVALTFKIMFFSYYVVKEIGIPDPVPDPISGRFL